MSPLLQTNESNVKFQTLEYFGNIWSSFKAIYRVPHMYLNDFMTVFNPYPYGPIANLFPMGGGRHVSPSYDVF